MTAIETDVTAVHAPGTDLAPYAAPAVEEYRPRIVMAPDEAKALDDKLRECMRAILREDVDFGTIPGAGDKKNLLKPGAEKLLQWFGFGSRSREVKIERDDPEYPSGIADKARRIGVTYRTEITKTIPGFGEVIVATCEGYAGYDEDRYFTTAEDARAKAESRERANAARYQRAVNSAKWENAADYRAPWNTLIKMAQKRSYVGAAIDATGAAGLFTQDMEDVHGAAAGSAGFIAAAEAAILALPENIRDAVDKWYRGKKWPSPASWTPEQWCAALQAAGYFSGRPGDSPQTPAGAAGSAAPAPESRPAPPPATDEDWFGRARGRVARVAGKGEWRGLWEESAAMVQAGKCTREDAARVQEMLRARADELGFGKPAAPALDENDPWLIRIRDIATAAEAETVADELFREFGDRMAGDDPRLVNLRNALADRAGEVADVIAGAVAA